MFPICFHNVDRSKDKDKKTQHMRCVQTFVSQKNHKNQTNTFHPQSTFHIRVMKQQGCVFRIQFWPVVPVEEEPVDAL